MDVDAIGAATTGGLMGAAVERPAGRAGEPQRQCTDCGAPVAGRFCENCGQPTHLHRTLAHLGEELLHGVMHFDSRTWRTLPLLAFRPGRLTREWVHGRRTRYVSPLAMFLFTVFVMFMLLSYMPTPSTSSGIGQQAVATAELARRNSNLANAQIALRNAPAADRAAAEAAVRQAEAAVEKASGQVGDMDGVRVATTDWKEELAAARKAGELQINTGDKKLDEKIAHKLDNPELAIYKLQQTFYKFSFLLVPISIPFVALLFLWKRGFTLYDHGVFVLYSLTFMSMLALAVAAASRLGGAASVLSFAVLPFAIPLHMFFQLKGAYGLGWFSALWRTVFLMVFCAIALALFILAIVWLGMA